MFYVINYLLLQSAVMISCKSPVVELKTVKDYRDLLVEALFYHAMNQRFFKISRKKDPPYFPCSVAADVVVQPIKAYIMTSSCKEKGTLNALESMLTEVLIFIFIFYCGSISLNDIFSFRLLGFGYMGFLSGKYPLHGHQ